MVPLKEVLEERFGNGFPVGAGSTKRDDPLVITDQQDYVSIEYGVAKFLLEQMGLEYEFEQQQTHNYEGRMVDELVYAAKEAEEPTWTQTRRFFFDITAGFHKEQEKERTGHSERFTEFLSNWYALSKNNRKIYREIVKNEPPARIEQLTHPVVLYKFIYGNLGIRLTDSEERELRDIYLQFDEKVATSSHVIPSFGAMRVLMALPNILLLVAIFVVAFREFSWVVIGAALFAKLWNGFARYLAGGGHPSAGFHTTVALLSLPTSLIISLLHAFRVVHFL